MTDPDLNHVGPTPRRLHGLHGEALNQPGIHAPLNHTDRIRDCLAAWKGRKAADLAAKESREVLRIGKHILGGVLVLSYVRYSDGREVLSLPHGPDLAGRVEGLKINGPYGKEPTQIITMDKSGA